MKKIAMMATLALGLCFSMPGFSQTAAAVKHHAVVPLNTAEGPEWEMMLHHVENLQTALKDEGGVEVEIVFYGPGLSMLLKSDTKHAAALKKLSDAGVKMAACQNAMKFLKVTSADLPAYAFEVNAGVAEVVRKQTAGWSFLP